MRPIDADVYVKRLIKLAKNAENNAMPMTATQFKWTADDMKENAPTINGWISVKDRLPEINKDVLILYESKVSHETGYAITCMTDSFYFGSKPIPYSTPQWLEPWQYFRENNVITHWMSLPEPPKEVKQDE